MNNSIVTRIAPSPTGQMHIGTVRTALFNYLWAKHNNGTFFVRIEDTDAERNRQEWTEMILSDFAWCGIIPDRTYIQSEHLSRHKELLEKLTHEKKAYISKEVAKDGSGKEVEVVRLKNPGKLVTFTDHIRGDITFDTTELGDFVIARALDAPLYHFAVVVDDADAGVTHVIRGEDILSSTPRQILIQEALGFNRPEYIHLPLILSKDRKKLSKRKDVVSLDDYRKRGFLPEAIINYLALLGWNPRTDEEIFTLEELIARFSLEHLQKSGAIFDDEKLKWVNREHLKKIDDVAFRAGVVDYLPGKYDTPMLDTLIPILRERLSVFSDIDPDEIDYFYSRPTYKKESLLWKDTNTTDAQRHLEYLKKSIDTTTPFVASMLHEVLMPYADEWGRGAVLWPFRFALTGKEKSPDPFTVAEILGKDEVLARLEIALNTL